MKSYFRERIFFVIIFLLGQIKVFGMEPLNSTKVISSSGDDFDTMIENMDLENFDPTSLTSEQLCELEALLQGDENRSLDTSSQDKEKREPEARKKITSKGSYLCQAVVKQVLEDINSRYQHPQEQYICICHGMGYFIDELLNHYKKKSGTPLIRKCSICKNSFKSSLDCFEHLVMHHFPHMNPLKKNKRHLREQ